MTWPVPVPLGVTPVIQESLLEAFHGHVEALGVTVTAGPAPAPLPTDALVGAIWYVQPASMMVTVWPATISVPVRCASEVLPATVKVACPEPVPDGGTTFVIQLVLLDVVQLHPPGAGTLTGVPGPPALPIFSVVGLTEKVQPPEAWLCVTVNV